MAEDPMVPRQISRPSDAERKAVLSRAVAGIREIQRDIELTSGERTWPLWPDLEALLRVAGNQAARDLKDEDNRAVVPDGYSWED